MRYVIAQLDLPPEIKKKYNIGDHDYHKKISTYTHVFVCKQCAAELYGEIRFENLNAYADSDTLRQLRRKAQDDSSPKEASSAKRQLRKIEREKEAIYAGIDQANALYEASTTSAVCPVCGAKLQQEKGYFLPDKYKFEVAHKRTDYYRLESLARELYGFEHYFDFGNLTTLDARFAHLKKVREGLDRETASAQADAYARSCDLFIPGVPSAQSSAIMGECQQLKNYILNLLRLESNIYSLQQLLQDLYYRRLAVNQAAVFESCSPIVPLREQLKELQENCRHAQEAVAAAQVYEPQVSVTFPVEPTPPVLAQPGLFNKKKVAAENEMLMQQYQLAVQTYRIEMQRCQQEQTRLIAQERQAVLEKAQADDAAAKAALAQAETGLDERINAIKARPVPAKATKALLDQEIASAEELLKKTFAARNELYALDIIFGKYRDPVALASFYEYLMAGRCTTLEGPDGAYNLYENEIRLNRVISQLDQVITSLEAIKQTQYMIYQEMCTANALLGQLNTTMDKALTSIQNIEANTTQMSEYMGHIAQNSDVIAHNSAVTAYYSKVNAELTNALGFMVALK